MTSIQHFYISGRVQGVYYRASTQAKARELGLVGWVRNLPDGRVEALACGDAQTLAEFQRWLWQGSERAEVSEVEVLTGEPGKWQEFEIR